MGMKNKANSITIAISSFFAAIISFVKPPVHFDDLLRFYSYYDKFLQFNVGEFIDFVYQLPDFLLPILLFICAKTGISPAFLLSVVTFASVYLVLSTSFKISRLRSPSIWFIIALVCSINVAGLLSGVRNFLAVSIIYYSLYQLYCNKKKIISWLFLLLALSTHFGAILLLPLYFAHLLNKSKIKNLLIVTILLSIICFLVISYSVAFYLNLQPNNAYAAKILHYLGAQEFWQFNTFKEYIINGFLSSWFLITIIYVYSLTKKKLLINNLDKIMIISCMLMLALITNYILFTRISYLVKIVWVVSLYSERIWSEERIKKITLYLSAIFILQVCLYVEGLFNFIK